MNGRWLAAGIVVGAWAGGAGAQLPRPGTPTDGVGLVRGVGGRVRAEPLTKEDILPRVELPRGKARPRPLCSLPGYPYTSVSAAPVPGTLTAVSLVRVPAERLPGTPAGDIGATQVYQFLDPRLQLDHCFLSRMAVSLAANGTYRISFRADQNPQPGGADVMSPLPPGEALTTTLQTTQLRRNLFFVTVRGYANSPPVGGRPGPNPTAPVVWEVPVEPFFVERGRPYSGLVEGRSEAARRAYPLVDRVEVEFTYR